MKKILPIALLMLLASCGKNDSMQTTYQVNDAVSKAEWKGSAPGHFHVGCLKVTGSLQATDGGEITGGDFTIPIASI